MRKVATATVVTGVAALGIAGVAHAVSASEIDQGLVYKISGSHGTKAKPKSVTLTTTITTSAKDASQNGTFATKKTVLFFDKNLKFNPSKFPTCTETQANATDTASAAACKKAQVGTGATAAVAGQGGAVKVAPTARYFNGPNNTLIIRLDKAPSDAVDGSGTLIGKLKSASGKFGKKLDVAIPAKYQSQLGLTITLTKFTAKIKKTATVKGKKVGYVESVGCSSGNKYNFDGSFTYSDGSTNKVPSSISCK